MIRGDITISLEAAKEFSASAAVLIGVEGLTVGSEKESPQVHREFLEKEIVILEGLVLKDVPDGDYFLIAQPLKLGGLDGSPVRPLLLEE